MSDFRHPTPNNDYNIKNGKVKKHLRAKTTVNWIVLYLHHRIESERISHIAHMYVWPNTSVLFSELDDGWRKKKIKQNPNPNPGLKLDE